MKYRDHEKIVNQLEHKDRRQLATLQAKIRRLEHIITLAEDPTTAPVGSALYTEYLAEQPAQPKPKLTKDAETIQLMIDLLIAVAQKYPDEPNDAATVGALVWAANRSLDWTAACEAAAHLLTAINQPPPPTP